MTDENNPSPAPFHDEKITIVKLTAIEAIAHNDKMDPFRAWDRIGMILDAHKWQVYDVIHQMGLGITPYTPKDFTCEPRATENETDSTI